MNVCLVESSLTKKNLSSGSILSKERVSIQESNNIGRSSSSDVSDVSVSLVESENFILFVTVSSIFQLINPF